MVHHQASWLETIVGCLKKGVEKTKCSMQVVDWVVAELFGHLRRGGNHQEICPLCQVGPHPKRWLFTTSLFSTLTTTTYNHTNNITETYHRKRHQPQHHHQPSTPTPIHHHHFRSIHQPEGRLVQKDEACQGLTRPLQVTDCHSNVPCVNHNDAWKVAPWSRVGIRVVESCTYEN